MRQLEEELERSHLLVRGLNRSGASCQASLSSLQAASQTSQSRSEGPSSESAYGTSLSPPSSDARSLITENAIALDDDATRIIESGQVALADILREGLAALRLLPPLSSSTSSRGQSTHALDQRGNPETELQTDRILVPRNSMKVHSHSLPDLYSNHLRVRKFVTVAAVRANAELLGISFEGLIDHDAPSPFFIGESGTPKDTWDSIPPDLRPTATQMRHQHPCYIDVLPFAVARERIINMMRSEPPMLDENEFCDDLEKEGLICWGTTTDSDEGMGSGTGAPWDGRSWEAQPWFLKKWWLVLGGPDGALFKQTRWWHEFRGDRLPDLW